MVQDSRFKLQYFRFFLLISSFCLLTTYAFAQTDDEIIKIDSSLVVLNATITDVNGKPGFA
jgi:hypothetical protein